MVVVDWPDEVVWDWLEMICCVWEPGWLANKLTFDKWVGFIKNAGGLILIVSCGDFHWELNDGAAG